MDKKWTIPLVIVLAVLFVLAVAYIADNQHLNNSGERMSFNVSSGSYRLSEFIKDVKTKPYYKGYDAQTVKWMESLGNKKVYLGNDSIVIMNGIDAMKLPETPGITDVYIYDLFTAEVIETHSLGDGYPTVHYVKNVKDANQEIISNGLA